jgi:predicted PurR-regulated permease PerM
MEIIIAYFKKPFIKRLLVLIIFAFALFLIRQQITLFLLTFIFIYLVNTAQKHVSRIASGFIKLNRKVVIVALYVIIAGLLFLLIYSYVPRIVQQVTDIVKSVTYFILNYDMMTKTNNIILSYIYDYLQKIDIQSYIKDSGSYIISFVSNAGGFSVNLIVSVLLSLFFLLEKEQIMTFIQQFKTSKLAWFYVELEYFGGKFTNSFGKVIQTQILISLINSAISVVILSIMQFHNTIGLFIMVFILGLVPVAGVFISIVPLSIIAYTVGGFNYIIYMIILITALHVLEGYILNPKLMSQNTKLPVFVTFLVLIVSEHLMGIWGLIVGIPITVFFLDVLEVKRDT